MIGFEMSQFNVKHILHFFKVRFFFLLWHWLALDRCNALFSFQLQLRELLSERRGLVLVCLVDKLFDLGIVCDLINKPINILISLYDVQLQFILQLF